MAQPRRAEGDGRRALASGAGRSLGHPGWPGSGAAGRRGPPCSGWPGLGCVWSRGFYPGALQSVNLGFWMPGATRTRSAFWTGREGSIRDLLQWAQSLNGGITEARIGSVVFWKSPKMSGPEGCPGRCASDVTHADAGKYVESRRVCTNNRRDAVIIHSRARTCDAFMLTHA